jgi:hypothetical protein
LPITALDLVLFAARNSLVISHSIAGEAVQTTEASRPPWEVEERGRYEAKIWNGKGELPDPTLGLPERWTHGNDGSSQSAIEALAEPNGVVYWLFRDGVMVSWQPHRCDIPGRGHLVDDPDSPNHWEVGAAAHIDREVQRAVDEKIYRAALDKALALHEERSIPYGVAIASRP